MRDGSNPQGGLSLSDYAQAEGVSWVKIPEDVLAIASDLENRGQQDRFFGLYIRHFVGAPPEEAPRTLRPAFRASSVIADRIKTGIRTGGQWKSRKDPSEGPAAAPTEPLEDPATTRQGVYESPAITHVHTAPIAAETFPDPLRGPNGGPDTTYSDSETKTELSTHSFIPPTAEEVEGYRKEQGLSADARAFVDYYEAKGWMMSGAPMRDWRAAYRSWSRNPRSPKQGSSDKYAKYSRLDEQADSELIQRWTQYGLEENGGGYEPRG